MPANTRLAGPPWMIMCAYVLALVASGCGAGGDRAYSRGSTVTILYQGDERAVGWHGRFLMFLPLVSYNENLELEGRLVERWEHSPDYRQWTLHLRTDVRWHDGVPFTAHDIKFSMELLEYYNAPALGEVITVLDDSTLTIRYTRPSDALDPWGVIHPKHLLEDLDPEEYWDSEFWQHPVGNGPYRYVRHVPNTMIELEANADYYRGKPRIERVVLKFGGSAPLPELLSGNVDVITYVNRADIPELVADPRFRVYDHLYDFDWLDVIFWNHRHHLFRQPAVRRALTLAINRRELHQVLNLPADLPTFDVLFTARQYRKGELPEPLPYDPAAAKRLLREAGWRDEDGDGLRERDGEQFRFETIVRAGDELEHAAVYVQSQLRRVGIQMDVKVLDVSVVRERLRSGDFHATIHRMGNQASGDGHLAWFGEDSRIGWHNPRVAELLHAAELAIDPDEQDRIYRELMPMFQAELPATFLEPQVETFVAHRRLRGLSSPFWANPLQNMDYLWLEDER